MATGEAVWTGATEAPNVTPPMLTVPEVKSPDARAHGGPF